MFTSATEGNKNLYFYNDLCTYLPTFIYLYIPINSYLLDKMCCRIHHSNCHLSFSLTHMPINDKILFINLQSLMVPAEINGFVRKVQLFFVHVSFHFICNEIYIRTSIHECMYVYLLIQETQMCDKYLSLDKTGGDLYIFYSMYLLFYILSITFRRKILSNIQIL